MSGHQLSQLTALFRRRRRQGRADLTCQALSGALGLCMGLKLKHANGTIRLPRPDMSKQRRIQFQLVRAGSCINGMRPLSLALRGIRFSDVIAGVKGDSN